MKYQKHEAKAWARKNLPGINGGIIQPLNKDYSIDYGGTRAWIERQIAMGVDSITCDGACGEWLTYTVEERKKIYEVAVDAVAGRVPLLANTSHPSIMAAVELAKHAQAVGVDALMHVTPYANCSGNEGVLRYYQYLAERVDIGICLYNTRPSGYVLSPEFIKELAEKIPNVCGIKQGMGSLDQTLRAYALAGDLIVIGDPFEDYWPEQMRYMPDTAMQFCNFVGALFQTPEKPRVTQYTRLFKEGRSAEAYKIFNELSPLRVLFHETQVAYLSGKGVFPLAALKYWAEKLGLPGGPVRPPFETLNAYTQGRIDARLAEAGLV
ncbi:MAG: dihydrodipicolinate synthase family protein [Azonexus sp.]|jgi:4-hydroxy-tetrahydrodipicolinate synthase|nr:dihydrodipicolinate synthase family protein [Azonexus sp.]